MSLILGKGGVQKLLVGYPTVSDKYNVGPGVVEGPTSVLPGDLVYVGSAHGSYVVKADAGVSPVAAGFAIATNVKVPGTYPAPQGPVPFAAGEAFGLFVSGYLAVELASGAVLADAKEGAKIYIDATSGKLTTVSTSNAQLVGEFTGVTELQGTKKVAEIFVPYMEVIPAGE